MWAAYVVAFLLLLDVLPSPAYPIAVVAAGLILAGISRAVASPTGVRHRWVARSFDRQDLIAIGGFYAGVVALFSLAFRVFTTGNTLGLFLCFAAGLLLGTVGPIVYNRVRRRPLSGLGIGGTRLGPTLLLGLLFAGTQYWLTLRGYPLPAPLDGVPLLVMSLVVGLFEAIFFRGFIQGRLVEQVGLVPAVAIAAAMYSLYHVGYGMGGSEMLFLFGLGVVYAVAFQITENILIIWPLLTRIGAFFNNLRAGDLSGALPWASILGFLDVAIVVGVVVFVTWRRQRRDEPEAGAG